MKNELRLGNLVYLDAKPLPKGYVHSIEPMDFFNNEEREIHPIKLTEEWFTKFGFELEYPCGKRDDIANCIAEHPLRGQDDAGWRIFPFQLSRSMYDTWRLSPLDYSEELIKRSGLMFTVHDIKFVHQLQNLYYSITGRELVLAAAFHQNSIRRTKPFLLKLLSGCKLFLKKIFSRV